MIPWFAHRELVCPICQTGTELDRAEFNDAKALIDDTQQYREQQMTEGEYLSSVHDFERQVSFVENPIEFNKFEETGPKTDEVEHPPESSGRSGINVMPVEKPSNRLWAAHPNMPDIEPKYEDTVACHLFHPDSDLTLYPIHIPEGVGIPKKSTSRLSWA